MWFAILSSSRLSVLFIAECLWRCRRSMADIKMTTTVNITDSLGRQIAVDVYIDDGKPKVITVGPSGYRLFLNMHHRNNDHARLKALFNAGYRGAELYRTCGRTLVDRGIAVNDRDAVIGI